MSDFEAVLERLLTDLSFAAALVQDPARALAGYRLSDGEAELLRSQVSGVAEAGSHLTGSAAAGSLSSLGEWAEFGTAAGVGAGHAAGTAISRLDAELDEPAARTGLGDAPEALRDVPDTWGAGAGLPAARTGLGDAPDLDGLPAVTRLGDAPRSGLGEAATRGVAEPEHLAPPNGYRNRVDADGDGSWDKATYRGRRDGGVDILVDLNGDGRADFIGHDKDRDWVVDSAQVDRDRDGIFEKRMYDDDGDGWLDRTVWRED